MTDRSASFWIPTELLETLLRALDGGLRSMSLSSLAISGYVCSLPELGDQLMKLLAGDEPGPSLPVPKSLPHPHWPLFT